MTQEQERWVEIFEFPGYLVSDRGNVLNTKTGAVLKITKNAHECRMVGLMKDGVQHKRSLALLVARAFIPDPQHEVFDTPIHLDGDRNNIHYQNLMWRPRWFARRYMRQFTDNHPTYAYPIEDVDTGWQYASSMDAAMTHGLLDIDIYEGMMNNVYVWPTHQTFRKVLKS